MKRTLVALALLALILTQPRFVNILPPEARTHHDIIFWLAIGLIFLIAVLIGTERRLKVGSGNCSSLEHEIKVSFSDIDEKKQDTFIGEVQRILGEFGKIQCHGDTDFSIANSTVCLGEIHSSLMGVATVPLELSDYSVALHYSSLAAAGKLTVTVVVKATPGSTVMVEGAAGPVQIGESGQAIVEVKVTGEKLARGFLIGNAVKGALRQDIRIPLS